MASETKDDKATPAGAPATPAPAKPEGSDLPGEMAELEGLAGAPLVTLCDFEGFLGVFRGVDAARKAVEGHKGPVVGQAWPAGIRLALMGETDCGWLIPSIEPSLPPLYVTEDRDAALLAHHALAEIGAAPSTEDIDVWRAPIGELTPPGKRRLAEHRRDWTDSDRVWATDRFRALQEGSLLSEVHAERERVAFAGPITELVVRRDRPEPPPEEKEKEGEVEGGSASDSDSSGEGVPHDVSP